MVTMSRGDHRICSLCLGENEITRHILCECPNITRLYYLHFSDGFPEASFKRTTNAKDITKLSKEDEQKILVWKEAVVLPNLVMKNTYTLTNRTGSAQEIDLSKGYQLI